MTNYRIDQLRNTIFWTVRRWHNHLIRWHSHDKVGHTSGVNRVCANTNTPKHRPKCLGSLQVAWVSTWQISMDSDNKMQDGTELNTDAMPWEIRRACDPTADKRKCCVPFGTGSSICAWFLFVHTIPNTILLRRMVDRSRVMEKKEWSRVMENKKWSCMMENEE